MKAALFLSLFLLGTSLQVQAAQPKPVPLISRGGQRSQDWYAEQAQLWQKVITTTPNDAGAWRSYYLATEYSYLDQEEKSTEKEEKLNRIFAAMDRTIPDTYEHLFIQQRRTPFGDFSRKIDLIERALQLCPDCAELYENLGSIYELTDADERATEIWTKLYQSRHIAPGLFDFNYNILMSTGENAILFTNGDNDTFPTWVLQRAKGIRPDILLLNLNLVQNYRFYLAAELRQRDIDIDVDALSQDDPATFTTALVAAIDQAAPDVPVYFALTVSNQFKKQLHNRLYMVGLASRYSTGGIDNLGRLTNNIENRFRLDYLNHGWYSEDHPSTRPVVEHLNTNYAYPFLLLADHYRAGGETARSARWRNRAFDLARPNPFLLEQITERIDSEK